MNPLFQKSLQVDHSNGYTAGHFEGHPIVPGAVSLKWMLDALAESLGIPMLESFNIRNFKCLRELAPPCAITITVHRKNAVTYTLQLKNHQETIASTEVDYPSCS